MLQPSRRDRLALEPLLPYINHEITADPEQRETARRAARRQAVAQASSYFRNLRAEEEKQKERELRAKLNGAPTSLHHPRHTDRSGSRVDTKPWVPSHSAEKSTDRHVLRPKASTRPRHSDRAEERYEGTTHRTLLPLSMSKHVVSVHQSNG
jgi:hypothetical protein